MKFVFPAQSVNICLKVEIFLEQREVAFLSPSKICENLNFSTEIFANSTYLCSKIISTLTVFCEVARFFSAGTDGKNLFVSAKQSTHLSKSETPLNLTF